MTILFRAYADLKLENSYFGSRCYSLVIIPNACDEDTSDHVTA